jgi:hypothetical protein
MNTDDLYVEHGVDGDFVKCSDLYRAVEEAGFNPQSSVYLGRLVNRTFGIKSTTKKINGKGYAGYLNISYL